MLKLKRRPWLLPGLACGLMAIWPGPMRAQDPAEGSTVNLPPFIVEDSGSPLHWHYAEFDHFQVLSLCSNGTTGEFLRELYVLEEQLSWVLPEQFRFQTSAPISYLLCDTSMQQRLDQDIPAETFLDQNGRPKPAPQGLGLQQHFVTVPHLGLQDDDAYMTFALLNSDFLQSGQMSYLPEAMEKLLTQRTPPLPSWFISGFMYLYGSLTFIPPTSGRGTYESLDGKFTLEAPYGRKHATDLICAPFVWISPKEGKPLVARIARQLYLHQPAAPLLLPMEDLLVKPNPPPGPASEIANYRRVWIAQSALFVRCALDNSVTGPLEDQRTWRDCFWTFLARSSTEPVTQAMFHDCFGLSFDEMQEKLARYFLVAAAGISDAGLGAASRPPRTLIRDATPGEVARIKGDWERMEIGFVKKAYPALGVVYQEHAHQTLWRAYDHGDRDPRLLAEMGLYGCDVGDDSAAQPLLAAAIAAQVLRPRAYFELARIRYAAEVAKPEGLQGKLSAGQTGPILALLADGRKQSPPLLPSCELFANIWFHSELVPSPPDLAELEAETVLFPRSSGLTFQTALLEAQAGRLPAANQLIDRGLQQVEDAPGRARLVQLKALLAAPGAAN